MTLPSRAPALFLSGTERSIPSHRAEQTADAGGSCLRHEKRLRRPRISAPFDAKCAPSADRPANRQATSIAPAHASALSPSWCEKGAAVLTNGDTVDRAAKAARIFHVAATRLEELRSDTKPDANIDTAYLQS